MDDFQRGQLLATQAASHRRADFESALARLSVKSNRLVLDFAAALANKLAAADQKYGYGDAWDSIDWNEEDCRKAFLAHVHKGDPTDVAIYCAFMWRRNWPTSLPVSDKPTPTDTLTASLQTPESQALLTALLAFANASAIRSQEVVS